MYGACEKKVIVFVELVKDISIENENKLPKFSYAISVEKQTIPYLIVKIRFITLYRNLLYRVKTVIAFVIVTKVIKFLVLVLFSYCVNNNLAVHQETIITLGYL